MFARDTHKPAGSEARGEGRERGNLIETTPKPPDAQRAGGIYMSVARCRLKRLCQAPVVSCHVLLGPSVHCFVVATGAQSLPCFSYEG